MATGLLCNLKCLSGYFVEASSLPGFRKAACVAKIEKEKAYVDCPFIIHSIFVLL